MTTNRCRGITLIEMLSLLGVLLGALYGFLWGVAAVEHPLLRVLTGIGGAIAGGLGVVAAMVTLVLIFSLPGALRRALEPAESACRCGEQEAPAHLLPQSETAREAMEISRSWMDTDEFRAWREALGWSADALQARLDKGTLSLEQISAAARLGHEGAAELEPPPVRRLLNYQHWAKLPEDLQDVLRSGLPPRLCLVWATACVHHALSEFENEFHQDTRPRQTVGAALSVLLYRNSQAEQFFSEPYGKWWKVRPAEGCRVVRRSLMDRIFERRTRGEWAAEAAQKLASGVRTFLNPAGLWTTYSSGDIGNAYMTPGHRCAWSQPCFAAEDVAFNAVKAAPDPAAEHQWQREKLARMILGWSAWEVDRAEWARRVEEEWIPRIEAASGLPFDVPKYVQRVREELIPWELPHSSSFPSGRPLKR